MRVTENTPGSSFLALGIKMVPLVRLNSVGVEPDEVELAVMFFLPKLLQCFAISNHVHVLLARTRGGSEFVAYLLLSPNIFKHR